MNTISEGLLALGSWEVALCMLLGLGLGLLVGAFPGVTATMAVALASGFTLTLDPVPGLCVLLTIYVAANFGDRIPAILINTPGTPASIDAALDCLPDGQEGPGRDRPDPLRLRFGRSNPGEHGDLRRGRRASGDDRPGLLPLPGTVRPGRLRSHSHDRHLVEVSDAALDCACWVSCWAPSASTPLQAISASPSGSRSSRAMRASPSSP